MKTVGLSAKPLPVPDADSIPYWDGVRRRELLAQCCNACRRWRWPPQGLCPHCYSWDFAWKKLTGTGVLLTFVVVHDAPAPAFAADVPYVIATIVMDGTNNDVVMTSNIVNCAWEEVKVGAKVHAVFDKVASDFILPKFILDLTPGS
jgi:uncharacterized protein